MKFPSIKAVRAELVEKWRSMRRSHNKSDVTGFDGSAGVDVRLQVYPNGRWAVRFGSADYDQDHRGYWGASFIGWERSNLEDIARDLVEQVKDEAAQR